MNKNDALVLQHDIQDVKRRADSIEPGLVDTDQTLQLTRAVARASDLTLEGVCTVWEHDSCLADALQDPTASRVALDKKYGMGYRTIGGKLKKVEDWWRRTPEARDKSEEQVRDSLRTMTKQSAGYNEIGRAVEAEGDAALVLSPRNCTGLGVSSRNGKEPSTSP